jgi:hypothetical protein
MGCEQPFGAQCSTARHLAARVKNFPALGAAAKNQTKSETGFEIFWLRTKNSRPRARPIKYPSFPRADKERRHHIEWMGHRLAARGDT